MITLSNDLAGLSLREVLDRAGRVLAKLHGLAPAAGVQKAYDLSLAELVTLHDVHDLVPEIEAAAEQPINNAAEAAAVVAEAAPVEAARPEPEE